MAAAVLSGFVVAIVAPFIHRVTKNGSSWITGLLPLGLFLYFVSQVPHAMHGHVEPVVYDWMPSLNILLSFQPDGLGLLFAILISGIGFLVTIYSGGYLHGDPLLGRWLCFLMAFMASMLGVVLADNIITLFVFWELTSLTSYLLIGFKCDEEESRKSALQALLVTGLGGLAMLAGLIMMAIAAGSYEITSIIAAGDAVRNHPWYEAILILILLGAFTKSAQFPFHFWLPNAMAAPTPASAYLHSSTMVKAGLYLLARLSPVLAGTGSWHFYVTTIGAITMFLGAYLAFQQNILKKLLAYSTVSALGAITMLLGMGETLAIKAAMAFLFAHALYKAALFMVAGSVDHETGERNIQHLGGLARAMPLTMLGAVVAALSMSGIPVMFGFVAKELVYESALHLHGIGRIIITAVAVVSSMFFLVVSLCVAFKPFFTRHIETPKHPHEAPLGMWLGPILLGVCTLGFGLLPGKIGDWLIGPAAGAILNKEAHLHLALWHGVTPPLILSIITLVGGVAAFIFRNRLIALVEPVQSLAAVGPEKWYQWSLDGMMYTAKLQTRILQNGYLRYYLMTLVLLTVAFTGYVLFARNEGMLAMVGRQMSGGLSNLRFYEFGLALVILSAIFVAIRSKTRLAAVAAMGVVGFGIALIFVLFGAPDLAMTQFVIETLTVILFVLVFYHLPPYKRHSSTPVRIRDLFIAGSAGLLMFVLVLYAIDLPPLPGIAEYFAEKSYDAAHGRNIVNVILVDFRGIDTMGEITVLALAAVGAFSLLKLRLATKRNGK